MDAVRFLFAVCVPLAVLCHNHGGYYQGPISNDPRDGPIITPELQLPTDGRRCISIARQTKLIEIPIPYLCMPGKPGGIPLPQKRSKQTSEILVAMYWNGWRVCKHDLRMPMTKYIRIPTCCPGWESGPSGECSVPKGGMNGPCQNGGFMAPDAGMPRCICPPGFKGIFCEMRCPRFMNAMKPSFVDRLPKSPFMKQIMPPMKSMVNLIQQNLMRVMRPMNVPLANMLMPPRIRSPMPLPVLSSAQAPVSSPMMLMNMMAMKHMMSPPIQRKSFARISDISPVDASQHDQPSGNIKSYQPSGNIKSYQPSGNTKSYQPSGNIKSYQPNKSASLLNKVALISVLNNSKQRILSPVQPAMPVFNNKYYSNNMQRADPLNNQPRYVDKVASNQESCEDILKAGITRCIQEAGIDAFSANIFYSKNPEHPRIIQEMCSLQGGRLSSCILAGQNACGVGPQVITTRNMLLEFISSIGNKCNSGMYGVPPMFNMINRGSMVPRINMGRMPYAISPQSSLVPLPPSVLRNIGRKPFLPIPSSINQILPPIQLAQDLKRLECNNGGYVVIDSGIPVCECPDGFTGETCDTPVCVPECLNSGSCVGVEGTPMCICINGFSGLQCEEAVGDIPEEMTADITAVVDDSVLAGDVAPLETEPSQNVIDIFPVPMMPHYVKQDTEITPKTVPMMPHDVNQDTEIAANTVKSVESVPIIETVKTQHSTVSIEVKTEADVKLANKLVKEEQVVEDSTASIEVKTPAGVKLVNKHVQEEQVAENQKELQDEDYYIAGYPLWVVLSVSVGGLVLVLLFTICVCLCVKRRSKRIVAITSASALPEKTPMKDNIYVVGIPPPVYEIKGIPPLSYEEVRGEVINGNRATVAEEIAAATAAATVDLKEEETETKKAG